MRRSTVIIAFAGLLAWLAMYLIARSRTPEWQWPDDGTEAADDPGPPIRIARPPVDSATAQSDPGYQARRALCGQQRWATPPEGDHDAGGYLIQAGDETCIPLLMGILSRNRPTGRYAVCTYAHAHEALTAIVGEDQGWEYEAWRAWYARYKRQNLGTPGQP
ncbi:MAG TPA: hypothetical protein VGK67_00115 [Myxococcales bacterium]|jgi:hypothetical protein